jgi:antitoxin PrlF
MAAVLEVEATLTERYQTTVPTPVRQALHLRKHDKIVYKIGDGGRVILERSNQTNEEDPVLGQYLHFLARDIAAGNVRVLTPELAGRVKSLVEGVEVDLDAPLSADDE